MNDNRNYDFSSGYSEPRAEYEIIKQFVPEKAKVIDLACGDGRLLEILKKERNISGFGIELSDSGVELCLEKGLNVRKGRIDSILEIKENEFDISICNVTVQMLLYPEIFLREMKRISKIQIISFPNFAFIKNRFEMLFHGRMPKRMLYGYSWFNTGHIHQLSIKDFYELVQYVGGLEIESMKFEKSKNSFKNFLCKIMPNLFLQIPVFQLRKIE